MAFPVLIEHCDDQFAVTLVGVPTINLFEQTLWDVQ